jgi:hypothetical protein
MTTSTIKAARQIQREALQPEPVGKEWLSDFERLFADEFPSDCPAQAAVEGTEAERVQTNRFQEEAA